MKKYLFLLLVCLFCLSGCGEKEEELLSGMPKLTVVCGEESVEAVRGTFEWAYPEKNGTIAHVIADTLHPLEMEDLLTPLVIKPSQMSRIDPRTAYLLFDGPLPDRLTVCRWVDGADDPYAVHLEAEKVELGKVDGKRVAGFEIQLDEEYGIYEVCAQWGDGAQEGGEVSYVFAAQMWIPEVQSIG